MEGTIRPVRVEEFEEFMRFLEGCFGHSKGFFQREFPHLYQPDAEACSWAHILEKDGRWISHVGVYPLALVIDGMALPMGGIGGVCTSREARGQHGMSQLLYHAIGVMREKRFVLSGLGGDRLRYNTFGWDVAGLAYSLHFTVRSLDRAGAKASAVTDVAADEAVDTVAKYESCRACRILRPRLRTQLQKQRLRFFTAADGYVIGYGENWGPFSIAELASASGQEAALIRAVLARTNGSEAIWTVSPWDREVVARAMPAVSWWGSSADWSYRIIDLAGLLKACAPHFERRAAAMKHFDLSVGMVEHDRTDVASITLDKGKIVVEAGRRAKTHVELDPLMAVRLILGGAAAGKANGIPAALETLFPVPVHVPPLDHV